MCYTMIKGQEKTKSKSGICHSEAHFVSRGESRKEEYGFSDKGISASEPERFLLAMTAEKR